MVASFTVCGDVEVVREENAVASAPCDKSGVSRTVGITVAHPKKAPW